jgi:hypothetical protein
MMHILTAPAIILLLIPSIAQAAKPVTVAELEKIIDTERGQSDHHVANQLSALVLTERASSDRLNRWESEFPGPDTHAALLLLCDESGFLSLPASDISSSPEPPLDAQQQMLNLVVDYLNKTLHNLPNFMAIRTTTHFEESAQQAVEQSRNADPGSDPLDRRGLPIEAVNYLPLHFIRKSSVAVSYRDGRELESGPSDGARVSGLTTRGEFGPILSVILTDALRSRIGWGYWQQATIGRIAVFRYEVPVEKSHYLVEFHTRAR